MFCSKKDPNPFVKDKRIMLEKEVRDKIGVISVNSKHLLIS